MDLFGTMDALQQTDKIREVLIKVDKSTFEDFIGTNRQNACLDNIMLGVIQN